MYGTRFLSTLFFLIFCFFLNGCSSDKEELHLAISGPAQVSSWEEFTLTLDTNKSKENLDINWENISTGETYSTVDQITISPLKYEENQTVFFRVTASHEKKNYVREHKVEVVYEPNLVAQADSITNLTSHNINLVYKLAFNANDTMFEVFERHFTALTEADCSLFKFFAKCINVIDTDNNGRLSGSDEIRVKQPFSILNDHLEHETVNFEFVMFLDKFEPESRSFSVTMVFDEAKFNHTTYKGQLQVKSTQPNETNNWQRQFSVNTVETFTLIERDNSVFELDNFVIKKQDELTKASYQVAINGNVWDEKTDARFNIDQTKPWQGQCTEHRATNSW